MKARARFLPLAPLLLLLGVAPAHAELLFVDQGPAKLPQGCNGSGCWTNYARVTDFDGDGDLDLIGVNCSGFFSSPQPQQLVVLANDGAGNFVDASSAFNVNAAVRQVAFGDIDGDGDLDVYIPSAGAVASDRLLVQTSPGTFSDEAASRLPANLASDAGATRMGDFDDDGDLDLVVTDGYINDSAPPAHFYENDGSGKFTAAPWTVPTTKDGVNPDDVDLGDVDGDLDLDLLINFHNGQNSLWLNDGAGNFTDASSKLPPLDGSALHYGPALCDVDGNGSLDLFVDNAGGDYLEEFALNDGAGTFTDSTDQITGNTPGADDNIVSCVDVDDDGDFDIVIGSLGTRERVFRNDAGSFGVIPNAFDGPQTDPTLWMEFGDLDGDKRPDAFTAQGEGNPQIERVYFANAAVAADTHAPRVIQVEVPTFSPSASAVVRFRLSDNTVTDEGPRLARAWIKVGATEVDAHFMGGDLFRAVAPATDAASFDVCATDLAGNSACETHTAMTGEGGAGAGGGANTGGNGSAGGPPEGGASANGGSGGSGGAGDGDGGGGDCSCRVPGAPRDSGAMLVGALALGLVAARSRRRGAR
ncbi:MAG: VCBS repeat-containing protein [Polyangiaceae bacterium]